MVGANERMVPVAAAAAAAVKEEQLATAATYVYYFCVRTYVRVYAGAERE